MEEQKMDKTILPTKFHTTKEIFENFKDDEIIGVVAKNNDRSKVLIQPDYLDFLIMGLFPYIKNDILENDDIHEKIVSVFIAAYDLKNIREYSNNK